MFYDLSSGEAGKHPLQLGLYILPPELSSGTDVPESNLIISSDTVDLAVSVYAIRSWAMVSSNMAGVSGKPDVSSMTGWSWHTGSTGYLLQADSAYDSVCESFIRRVVK